MAIARWSPSHELTRLQEDFDQLARRFFPLESLETSFARSAWEPTVDISETNNKYVVTAELPGLSKDEVKVNYEDGVLTIHGEKKQEKEEKGETFHRVERSYGNFERSFRLPAHIQAEKAEATFKNGVLILALPKTEQARPKEIPIRIS